MNLRTTLLVCFLFIISFIIIFLTISGILTYYACADCQHRKYNYDYGNSLITKDDTMIPLSKMKQEETFTSFLSTSTSPSTTISSHTNLFGISSTKKRLRKPLLKKHNKFNKDHDSIRNEDISNVRSLLSSLSTSLDQKLNISDNTNYLPPPQQEVLATKSKGLLNTNPPYNFTTPSINLSLMPLQNNICTYIYIQLYKFPSSYLSSLCLLYTQIYNHTLIKESSELSKPINYHNIIDSNTVSLDKYQISFETRIQNLLQYYKQIEQIVFDSSKIMESMNNHHILDPIQHSAQSIIAQNTSSFLSNTQVPLWNTSVLTSSFPSSEKETNERIQWAIQCRHQARSSLRSYDSTMMQSRNIDFYHKSYFELKEIAMRLYDATNYLWIPKPIGKGPPLVDAGFYQGPWLEEYWYYSFVTPIIRNITLAEYQYSSRRYIRGITIISDGIYIYNQTIQSYALFPINKQGIATLNIDDYAHIIPKLQRDSYKEILSALEQSEIQRTVYPTDTVQSLMKNNVPYVTIQEPFDFHLFYPYVPLFIPWDRIAVYYKSVSPNIEDLGDNHHNYVSDLDKEIGDIEQLLLSFTYTHVNYITVVHRAAGIYLRNKNLQLLVDNTIQINPGGGGDIPVPLLAYEHSLLPLHIRQNSIHKPWQHRLTFLGTVREGIRQDMIGLINKHPWYSKGKVSSSKKSLFYTNFYPQSTSGLSNFQTLVSNKNNNQWIHDMINSLLQLAPRGTNPSSYRFYEVLQLGLIPIYLYDNQYPWLPYQSSLSGLLHSKGKNNTVLPVFNWNLTSFIIHIQDFVSFLDFLPLLGQEYINKDLINTDYNRYLFTQWYKIMIRNIERYRTNYFTYQGIIQHIYRLLRNPNTAELYCTPSAQDYTKLDPVQSIIMNNNPINMI